MHACYRLAISAATCSYYKTGSLMANSCKAVALLGCYPDTVSEAAFKYGLHVGVAFQLIDDLLGECNQHCTNVLTIAL